MQASAGCAREYGGLTCKSMWKLGGTVGAEPRGACAYRGLPSRESSACMSIAGRPWECSGWGAHPGAAAGRARTGAAPSWASAGCGLPRRCGPAFGRSCACGGLAGKELRRHLGHLRTACCTFQQFRASMLPCTAVPGKQVAFFNSSETASCTFQQFCASMLPSSAVPKKHAALFSSAPKACCTFQQS